MVREFEGPDAGKEAYDFYKRRRSALARPYNGKWLVASPACAIIGHPSCEVRKPRLT